MTSVCMYFQIHQPHRVRRYRVFDIGKEREYFSDNSETDLNNERVFRKVHRKSYGPACSVLEEMLATHPDFKFALSISGVALEQFQKWAPDTIDTIRNMVATGRVELLNETYYHSLAFFYSLPEFERQVAMHKKLIQKLFGITPQVFRNTELSYTNRIAEWADRKGYKGILAEGWDHVLDWRSPNFLYRPKGTKKIKLLLKNYRLSDDMAFRFSEQSWAGWPLTAEKYAHWISSTNGNGDTVNLFVDFETFGEHQWEDTGIFDFLRTLPYEIKKHPDNIFMTPSEVADTFDVVGELDVPYILSWADTERDLSAWLGNEMQNEAIRTIYRAEKSVLASGDATLIEDWRKLQTSDHFYYMCTKWFNDGDVHAYFNPYESPYDAFISYMNVMKDLQLRLGTVHSNTQSKPVVTV